MAFFFCTCPEVVKNYTLKPESCTAQMEVPGILSQLSSSPPAFLPSSHSLPNKPAGSRDRQIQRKRWTGQGQGQISNEGEKRSALRAQGWHFTPTFPVSWLDAPPENLTLPRGLGVIHIAHGRKYEGLGNRKAWHYFSSSYSPESWSSL